MTAERNPPIPPSRQFQGWSVVLALVISLLMALAGWQVTANYSFWKDELFTAAAVADNWSGLLHNWILPDTAPPLYALLLKGWVSITGPSELGHRSLSLVFALFTLIAAVRFTGMESPLRTLVTVLFLGVSPGFVGHAQEARNYALTLFWATCLTGSSLALSPRRSTVPNSRWLRPKEVIYLLSSLCLSLSHYFGYLYASMVVVVDLRRRAFPGRAATALTLIAVLQIWPVLHLMLTGPASSRLGRVQWIEVTPVIGTLQEYLAGILPVVGIQAFLILSAIGCIALLFPGPREKFTRLRLRARDQAPELLSEIRHLLSLLFLFAILMVGVDLIRPISTARNYVVVLPATAFLMGDLALLIHTQANRIGAWLGKALLATVLVTLLADSVTALGQRTMPMMNYKLLARTIDRNNLCSRGCLTTTRPERISTYFDVRHLKKYESTKDRSDQLPILGLGEDKEDQRRLRDSHPTMLCFEPRQSKEASVFLLIEPEQANGKDMEGLHPCS